MDKGFYLYCIKRKGDSKFSTKGISGGEIFTVPYQDLEAVVSEVPLAEFGSEEVQRKAQEDLKWIEEKAQNHEKVIEEAMGKEIGKIIPIVPMQFGVVFKTKENLQDSLSKHFDQFKQSLEKLAGKQEWGMKVYLKEGIFNKYLEEKSEIYQEEKKKLTGMSGGAAFFAQKKMGDTLSKAREKELEKITQDVFEKSKNLAELANKGKNLEKDLTGRPEPMVLNVYYLVKTEKVSEFEKCIKELKEKYQPLGLEITYVGPWPPYHFA
jgi:hypothetical protein